MSENVETSAEMPKYQCHKKVWALQIKDIQAPDTLKGFAPDGPVLVFVEAGYAPIQVSAEWAKRHEPHIGGYYVVYEDNYRSFSPADAFESGYTKI